MHSYILRVTALLAVFAAPAACAQAVDRTQDLESFTTLELNGCFSAKLVPGRVDRVLISATPEQQERIRVRQDGARVVIEPVETRNWDVCRGGPMRIEVTASFAKDDAVELRLRGSGDLDAEVPASAKLTASIAGSGDLTLRGGGAACRITVAGSGDAVARSLECADSASVDVSGSGSVTLSGKSASCEYSVQGSGNVVANEYSCNSAAIDVSGSGSVDLAASASLEVKIRGSGNVGYSGQPALKDVQISGSGRLHQL